MSLLPYLKSAFTEYAQSGKPVFRSVMLDYPADARFYEVDDQFLVGDRLLVSPLFAGEASRKVHVPEGR